MMRTQPRQAKIPGRKRKRGRRKVGARLPPKIKYRSQPSIIITRKGQPRPKTEVPVLVQSASFGGNVASSWIAYIEWNGYLAEMELINGHAYHVYITFKVMQGWYYALSKGTYFNEYIKGKYQVRRIR